MSDSETTRVVLLVVAGVLAALTWAGWATLLFLDARKTDPRFLRPMPIVHAARGYRAMWQRVGLWFLSWPHVADRFLGSHRVPVGRTPARVVWYVPGGVVRRFHPEQRVGGRPPVLLVHAFITRPWILDLLPGRSLVEALYDAGYDVYLLDWGEPDKRTALHGFETKVDILAQAEVAILRATAAPALHVIGYCTGGTTALAAAATYGGIPLASITTIAPVIDTAVPGGLGDLMKHRALTPVWLLDGDGCVPGQVVREAFHALRPQFLRATIARIRSRRDPVVRETFAALVRWAWEQRRLGGRLFFEFVDLYRHNTLLEGRLTVRGLPVDLSAVAAPVLVAVTDRDHIVPIASSLALTHVDGLRTEVVRLPHGHVSMLMGAEAREMLFPAIVEWLGRHDEPAYDEVADRGQRG